jgi:Tfp pilus assembly protein PilP
MRSVLTVVTAVLFLLPLVTGCEKKTIPPVKPKEPAVEKPSIEPEVTVMEAPQGPVGYIYKPKGRRDPFIPLIMPREKKERVVSRVTGTLESYDIGDFKLSAIAKKGDKYYALLIAPDKRAFTVREGTVIGLHKGRIGKITADKVIIVEYSRDYRGELKPRQIVLELHKGR